MAAGGVHRVVTKAGGEGEENDDDEGEGRASMVGVKRRVGGDGKRVRSAEEARRDGDEVRRDGAGGADADADADSDAVVKPAAASEEVKAGRKQPASFLDEVLGARVDKGKNKKKKRKKNKDKDVERPAA